jgi:phosphatidate cytidylyltransferase
MSTGRRAPRGEDDDRYERRRRREAAREREPAFEPEPAFEREAEFEPEPEPEPRRPAARQPRARREAPPPRERRQRSDVLMRIVVAVPAALVAIVFIDVGGTAWAVFMAVMGCLCLQELYTMLGRWRPVPLVGFASVVAMCAAARFGNLRDVFEVTMGTVPVLFIAVIIRGQLKDATVTIAGTMLGVVWVGLAFGHAVLLRQLTHGNGIVLDIAVATFLGDTGAYFGGKVFGRRPLAPEISPNKTVEGLACGMVVTILAVYFAGLYQTYLTSGDTLALGVTIAVLGPMGDLFQSLIKRDAGVKDAGNLFGAHGGALDRLDGVIFTIVAGYYVWSTILH